MIIICSSDDINIDNGMDEEIKLSKKENTAAD